MNGDLFSSMRDIDFTGKRVLVRCDFNSPLSKTGEPLEFMRIRVYRSTFNMLKSAAKVVAISHQGRLGKDDCVTLRKHAEILSQALDQEVIFVDDTVGPKAMKAIQELKQGQVLVLENTRFFKEDNETASPEQHAKSKLVATLAPKFDYFINDAFSVCHRAHASVVGFPEVLPSCAGLVVEKEMEAMLRSVTKGRHPSIYIIGGNKLSEVIKVMEVTLSRNTVDKILLGGSVAQAFLYTRGIVPKEATKVINEKAEELPKLFERVKKLDEVYKERIELPIDVAIEYGGREEVVVTDPRLQNFPVMDIGDKTIQFYVYEIEKARAVLSKGPMGAYENPTFMKGTVKILASMERSKAYTLIGGGHMGNVAFDMGIAVDHISTAGGAVLAFMSGEALPGIEALKKNTKKFNSVLQKTG